MIRPGPLLRRRIGERSPRRAGGPSTPRGRTASAPRATAGRRGRGGPRRPRRAGPGCRGTARGAATTRARGRRRSRRARPSCRRPPRAGRGAFSNAASFFAGGMLRPADEADVALDRRAELLPVLRRRGEAQELVGRRVVGPPGERADGGGLDLRGPGSRSPPRPRGAASSRRPAAGPSGSRSSRRDVAPFSRSRRLSALRSGSGFRRTAAAIASRRRTTSSLSLAFSSIETRRGRSASPARLAQGRERGLADGGVGVLGQAEDALDLAARSLLAEDLDEDGLRRRRRRRRGAGRPRGPRAAPG